MEEDGASGDQPGGGLSVPGDPAGGAAKVRDAAASSDHVAGDQPANPLGTSYTDAGRHVPATVV